MADQKEQATLPQYSVPAVNPVPQSKYSQLLAIIDELGKDIKPTYAGNRMSAERVKRYTQQARMLVRECSVEATRAQHQAQQGGSSNQ